MAFLKRISISLAASLVFTTSSFAGWIQYSADGYIPPDTFGSVEGPVLERVSGQNFAGGAAQAFAVEFNKTAKLFAGTSSPGGVQAFLVGLDIYDRLQVSGTAEALAEVSGVNLTFAVSGRALWRTDGYGSSSTVQVGVVVNGRQGRLGQGFAQRYIAIDGSEWDENGYVGNNDGDLDGSLTYQFPLAGGMEIDNGSGVLPMLPMNIAPFTVFVPLNEDKTASFTVNYGVALYTLGRAAAVFDSMNSLHLTSVSLPNGEALSSLGLTATFENFVISPLDASPTPEPASMALLAMGGGLLAFGRKRLSRRRQSADQVA